MPGIPDPGRVPLTSTTPPSPSWPTTSTSPSALREQRTAARRCRSTCGTAPSAPRPATATSPTPSGPRSPAASSTPPASPPDGDDAGLPVDRRTARRGPHPHHGHQRPRRRPPPPHQPRRPTRPSRMPQDRSRTRPAPPEVRRPHRPEDPHRRRAAPRPNARAAARPAREWLREHAYAAAAAATQRGRVLRRPAAPSASRSVTASGPRPAR